MKCLGCYRRLDAELEGYHPKCSRNLFGTPTPPRIDFNADDMEDLAKQSIARHLGLTGVQPKISLDLKKDLSDPATHRLTIVGLWGGFILKPPTLRFPDMAVVEDATMHMARAVGIETAIHGLVRLKSGELAYVTRRFDRGPRGRKVAVEDFCQLSELQTARKYKASMEKAGKIIQKFSSRPGLDLVTFFDLTLFSFLTGNADMHLKNFSLLGGARGEYALSPAYDLLSTKLMPIDDDEETALTVNGKKAKLKRGDFEALGRTLQINERAMQNSFTRLEKALPAMREIIEQSFLPGKLKTRFESLLNKRAAVLLETDQ